MVLKKNWNLVSKYYLMRRRFSDSSEFIPHSTVKIFKRSEFRKECVQEVKKYKAKDSEYRENEVNIQMLSKNLYQQIFGEPESSLQVNSSILNKSLLDLRKHGIKLNDSPKLEDVILKLPKLLGDNIEDHFYRIAKEQSEPYQILLETLVNDDCPRPPTKWSQKPGWVVYSGSTAESIDFPPEDALVFDVETCVTFGPQPIIATAVGKNAWYSWVSPLLLDSSKKSSTRNRYSLSDFIPMGQKRRANLIVGHNVSYDRVRIKEEYLLDNSCTRFIDTMSLHVCVSGVTSYQRAMLKSSKELSPEDKEWSSQASLNSLAEVVKLYCNKSLEKEPREIFVKGDLKNVITNFQMLMTYCSNDVVATRNVLQKLYPLYCERFPHPATLAGMLELGSAYLPVNSSWERYIDQCNLTYQELEIESRYQLAKRADENCALMAGDKYKEDLWMWDQDWSTQEFKMKKPTKKEKALESSENFNHLYELKHRIPTRKPLLPGYPAWYRKLCSKPEENDWTPGASSIGTGMQITPKLLNLCWEGYPLHYVKGYGWGFLVPFRSTHPEDAMEQRIPIEKLVERCPVIEPKKSKSSNGNDDALFYLWKDVESNLSKKDFYSKAKKDKTDGQYTGSGVWCNLVLEGCCWFFKLPHKNGPSFRVGNPLARDFLNKFSENVLSGDGGESAKRVIQLARMMSYWRNNRDRIMGQTVGWSTPDYGAIIPQVVVCGTLTRRAMEPTWMTASNAKTERTGSELRSMIQAPNGYKIVGADVDSQELWIASILGDANSTGIHGATPMGWMTLSGTKSQGTDMHSMTAKAIGISRDQAKVINYARIYGAGQNFAQTLLKQFNPTISDTEAKSKAMKMFQMTKGKRIYFPKTNPSDDDDDDYIPIENQPYTSYEAVKISSQNNKAVDECFEKAQWLGGTESAMFNRLESIAARAKPVTPFLSCRLSRSLEPNPNSEDRFLPTRVNWVVQSGAVDFLHLMLVCMRWLMRDNVKFCLSFHDELRYLVKDEMAYKAALAMHATNLLTRSFCSQRIGLKDLPQSVAFFSSVEVDTVLRKESSMDCKTPSNPHGLEAGYGISPGETLTIHDAIKKTGNDMRKWSWHGEAG